MRVPLYIFTLVSHCERTERLVSLPNFLQAQFIISSYIYVFFATILLQLLDHFFPNRWEQTSGRVLFVHNVHHDKFRVLIS